MSTTEEDLTYHKTFLCKESIQVNVLRIILHKGFVETIDLLTSVTEKNELKNVAEDSEITTALDELVKCRSDKTVEFFFNIALQRILEWLRGEVDPVEGGTLQTSKIAYIAREMRGGIVDSLTGTYETVRYPKKYMQNLMKAGRAVKQDPVKVFRSLMSTIWNNPFRFGASVATGWLTGMAFSSLIGSSVKLVTGFNKTVKGVEAARKTAMSLQAQKIVMNKSLIKKLAFKSTISDALVQKAQSYNMLRQQVKKAAQTSSTLLEEANKLQSRVLTIERFRVFECKSTAESVYYSKEQIKENQEKEFRKNEHHKKHCERVLKTLLDALMDSYKERNLSNQHAKETDNTECKESSSKTTTFSTPPTLIVISENHSNNQGSSNNLSHESHVLRHLSNRPEPVFEATAYSIVRPNLLVNQRNWVVSIICKPQSLHPDHAYLVMQGLNQFGKGFFLRYHLVSDEYNPGYAKIIEASFYNIELEQLRTTFLKQVIKHAIFREVSWSINEGQAQVLLQDINQDKEKSIEYLVSGSESIVAKCKSTDVHNCFTWAREKLHNLRDERIQLPEIFTDLFVAKTRFHLTGPDQEIRVGGRLTL